jgi:hypothetical protein
MMVVGARGKNRLGGRSNAESVVVDSAHRGAANYSAAADGLVKLNVAHLWAEAQVVPV